jgi:hypothetical protein
VRSIFLKGGCQSKQGSVHGTRFLRGRPFRLAPVRHRSSGLCRSRCVRAIHQPYRRPNAMLCGPYAAWSQVTGQDMRHSTSIVLLGWLLNALARPTDLHLLAFLGPDYEIHVFYRLEQRTTTTVSSKHTTSGTNQASLDPAAVADVPSVTDPGLQRPLVPSDADATLLCLTSSAELH